MTPNIDRFVMELEERFKDGPKFIVVTDSVASLNIFVINEVCWCLGSTSHESIYYDLAGVLVLLLQLISIHAFPLALLLLFAGFHLLAFLIRLLRLISDFGGCGLCLSDCLSC